MQGYCKRAVRCGWLGLTVACVFAVSRGAAAPDPPAARATAERKLSGGVHRIVISPDGKQLAVGMDDGTLHFLDAGKLEPGKTIPKKPPAEPQSLAFRPDGRALLVSYFATSASIFALPGGTVFREINTQEPVSAVRFTPDGSRFLTYPAGGGVGIWDAGTGQRRSTVPLVGPGADELAADSVFSGDGKILVVSGGLDADHSVRVWDTATGKLRRRFAVYPKLVDRLAVTPNGSRLVTGAEDGMVRVWDLSGGQPLANWKVGGFVRAVAISADGLRVATSTDSDPAVHVWSVATSKPLAAFPGHPDGARDLALSANGHRLYSVAFDTIRRWEIAD